MASGTGGDGQGAQGQRHHGPAQGLGADAFQQQPAEDAAPGDGTVPGHHVHRQGRIGTTPGGIRQGGLQQGGRAAKGQAPTEDAQVLQQCRVTIEPQQQRDRGEAGKELTSTARRRL